MIAGLGILLACSGLVTTVSPAGASTAGPGQEGRRTGFVAVVEVSGLLDRVLVDFVEEQVADAEREGAVALVLQVNSKGSVVSDARLDRLLRTVAGARVPVDAWIGPSGSKAFGGAARLVAASRTSGIAPGSHVELLDDVAEEIDLGGRVAVGDHLGAKDAVALGVIDNDSPVIGQFVVGLDGVESEVRVVDGERRREPQTQVRFGQLPLLGQLLHTVASPAVAYLLLVVGLGLVVFELYTAGVGIAGVVGAGCLILSAFGLAELPVRGWAVGLILLAAFGFAVDVQTGVPRVWSGIAVVALVLGSVGFYDGQTLSWLTLLAGVGGLALAMIGGMPAMVRTRFSTPTIGREWMIGELGRAAGAIDPDGTVIVRDAPWRARTNRSTPLADGSVVRVVSIEGLVLEVEPETGGARDYRERRASRRDPSDQLD